MKALILIAMILAAVGCKEAAPARFNIGDKVCLKTVGGVFLVTWRRDGVDNNWWYFAHSSKGQKINIREKFLVKCD